MVGNRQLHFNNKSSFDDFGLYIEKFYIHAPTPKTFEENIPYVNGSINFDRVINFGERLYNNRNIDITLFYKSTDNIALFNSLSDIQTWLLNTLNSEIVIDGIDGFYVGKVSNISNLELLRRTGKLSLTFNCYPFRLLNYGEDIWDTFNFNLDVTEYTSYTINNSLNIDIVNRGVSVSPTIECSSDMNLIINGINFNLKAGINNIKKLKLKNGVNNIWVNGNGTININFRKELI